ncbi:type IV secretory system conjugative DNA transfer family protein [Euryhalocaulis caribicus]|uniref:type IV secretory system conjugative DNA transfer family protein n=1 Tax=Euryhalocaulis caribicus TaxID=1161401 RepID=UPI0009DB73D2|nr:type IV secretion system DNA-binding domain-containing protein [Euryhalocaulis caribicus]
MTPSSDANSFARIRFRTDYRQFGVNAVDRFSHFYSVGQTGVGKTTLLQTLIKADEQSGQGFALLDPHGDLTDRVVRSSGWPAAEKLLLIDVAESGCPLGYNPLAFAVPALRPLIASGLIDVFRHMWPDAWGPRMEYVLRYALLALLDQPDATLPDVLRLLSDKSFRYRVTRNIRHEPVRRFWSQEFPKYTWKYQADAIAPIQSKVGSFLADPRIYRFLTATEKRLRFRSIMDQGQVLLVNLSKGRLGSDSSRLLGGLIMTSLGLAAFSRADQAEAERRPYFIYADEFQNFTTLAIAEMLSELRKFGVGVVLAHQYLNQLRPEIRHAILGNAGTIISFRVGPEDAPFLAREFEPTFDRFDLINLPNHCFYIRLMINGSPSKPFSAETLNPRTLH